MEPFRVPAARRTLLGAALLAGALSLPSCEQGALASPERLAAGDIRSFVTPELSSGLSRDGSFTLPAPPAGTRVSPDGAREMALAFARTFGPSLRGTLERQHGRPIDFDRLHVGSPAYFAATPYEPLPPDVHPGLRNAYGPYYLLYLAAADDVPALVVAISASTEAWIENGRVRLPLNYGNDFYVEGVALGDGFVKPLSPEQAVRRVGEATGARITAVPELLLPHHDYHAVYARWRVTLDRPVAARSRGTGEVHQMRELYVGRRGEFFTPSPVQPGEHARTNPGTGRSVHVVVKRGSPVAFEPVDVANQ
ncbi:MAG: hypothetical protein AB1941_08690 [Gemmatimonadota bacterium]